MSSAVYEEQYTDPEPDVVLDEDLGTAVLVENIPVVEEDKYEKLKKLLTLRFSQHGKLSELGLFLPRDATTKITKGYAFAEYLTKTDAQKAAAALNNYALDKNHTFKVTLLSEVHRLLQVPEDYQEVKRQPTEIEDSLFSHLADPQFRDQFSVHASEALDVYWNNGHASERAYFRAVFGCMRALWSPLGTYLLGIHKRGAIVFGGTQFKRLGRFEHPDAQTAAFSPRERYLVTYRPQNATDSEGCLVWDIRSKQRVAEYPTGAPMSLLKFSHDDRYMLRHVGESLMVYEMPSVTLVPSRAPEVPGIRDAIWSPTDYYVSYFVPERDNVPASVTVIQMPNRELIGRKNFFDVADAKMHWHPQGDFLAVRVERFATKAKKKKNDEAANNAAAGGAGGAAAPVNVHNNFEIFRLRDKDCPVEVLEIREQVLSFAWEPKGNRFAVIHGDAQRSVLSVYSVSDKKGSTLKQVFTSDKLGLTHVYWSPQGRFLVACTLLKQTNTGDMVFFDADENAIMRTAEHPMMSDVEWDPSGRYVASFITNSRQKYQNEYLIWNFQGKLMQKCAKEELWSFSWRPRPKSLLTSELEKKIRDNFKSYQKRYEDEEAQKLRSESAEFYEGRARLRQSFEEYLNRKRKDYADIRQARVELRGGYDSDEDDFQLVEQEVEEIVSFSEEALE